MRKGMVVPMVGGLVLAAGAVLAAAAETKVELSHVHLCCGACVKGVATALKGVEGVKPACDQKAGKVTITATSDAAAQAALDALSKAGYHGKVSGGNAAFKPVSASKGKVSSLTLTGVHNCCASCCRAIKAAVKGVDGVKGDTAKPKSDTFDVTGDFEPAAVIEALRAVGFDATVK